MYPLYTMLVLVANLFAIMIGMETTEYQHLDTESQLQQQVDQLKQQLERAQIIVNVFRTRTLEIQEQLLTEQVEHEMTKRTLSKIIAERQDGNS